MKESNNDLIYFLKEQVVALFRYLEKCDNDKDLFLRDDLLKDAVMMKLIVLGEYSSKLSKSFKQQYSFVDWDLIKAGRNFYVHTYGAITWERVWETLETYVPKFDKDLDKIINDIEINNK